MKLQTLVWREIFERKSQLVTSFLAILLGITVIVSIKNITFYSEKAVAREMDSLGANVLVLPKSATLQDYYAADMQGETIPEEYVTQLAMSDLAGTRQSLAEAVGAGRDCRARPSRSPASCPRASFRPRRPGQGPGSSRGRSAAGPCRTMAFATGQEDAGPQAGHRQPGGQRSPGRGRRGRRHCRSRKATGSTCWASRSASRPCCRRPAPWTIRASSPTCTACRTCRQGAGHQRHRNRRLLPGDLQRAWCRRSTRLLPDAKVVTITQIADAQIKINRMMSNAVAHLPGDHRLRGRGEHRQLHVRERLRAAAGDRHADGAGGQLRLGPADLPAQGPVAGRGGRGRRLCARHGPGRDVGAEVGRRARCCRCRCWPCGPWCISVGLTLVASFFPARRAARLDPCATFQEI